MTGDDEQQASDSFPVWADLAAHRTWGEDDIRLGENFARAALEASRTDETCLLVPSIFKSMVEGGVFGELEAGFVAVICNEARRKGLH